MVTYNLYVTSKADRTFPSPDLDERLTTCHRCFDPDVPLREIRVIRTNTGTTAYSCGGSDALHARYIRVVIDLPVGKSEEEKRGLMEAVTECCLGYQGRHKEDCTVEVVVNELREGCWLVTEGKGG